ncbi:MAG: hypothetical protein WKF47_14275 [Geodermatophilaceae bacterium]
MTATWVGGSADRADSAPRSQPWDGYDYDTFTADLDALLQHLNLTDVTLVGFSMRGGEVISGPQRLNARNIAAFASPKGTLDCIVAFGRTDFRSDLAAISVPTLVIHGDSDGIVPIEVRGKRTHEAVAGSELVLLEGAPHGFNATHAEEFNQALPAFLAR